MTCTCFPDDARTAAVRYIAALEGRIVELVCELEAWPAADVGSQAWLDALEASCAARRQLDDLELLLVEE